MSSTTAIDDFDSYEHFETVMNESEEEMEAWETMTIVSKQEKRIVENRAVEMWLAYHGYVDIVDGDVLITPGSMTLLFDLKGDKAEKALEFDKPVNVDGLMRVIDFDMFKYLVSECREHNTDDPLQILYLKAREEVERELSPFTDDRSNRRTLDNKKLSQ